ncbi:MAG: hypothetical protein QOF01_4660 [Thermomicrobiales bacterium]|nr:hypothetical protein [Thermomicrobiales bacterium]
MQRMAIGPTGAATDNPISTPRGNRFQSNALRSHFAVAGNSDRSGAVKPRRIDSHYRGAVDSPTTAGLTSV